MLALQKTAKYNYCHPQNNQQHWNTLTMDCNKNMHKHRVAYNVNVKLHAAETFVTLCHLSNSNAPIF